MRPQSAHSNAFAPALNWYVLTIFGSVEDHNKGTLCLFWAHWGPLYIPPPPVWGWWCAHGDVEGFWFPQTTLLRAAAAGG